jgi:iron(III) transport system substrate-binding protein
MEKVTLKKVLLIAVSFILVFAFAACGQTAAEAPDGSLVPEVSDSPDANPTGEETDPVNDSGERITVYLSGPETMINKLEEAFEEETGDVCDFVIMSCGQLRSKVWAESEAGAIQADVVWGSDPLLYNLLDGRDLLEPLTIADVESIDEAYVIEDKNYALVNERYITIIYNTDMLEGDAPTGFADLANEQYSGLVVMADATQSSTAFAIACALYELEGNSTDYFQALKDNGVMLSKSNGLVPSTIMEGQFTVGIAPSDGAIRLYNKGKKEGYDVPLEIVWPSEGVIAIQRPIAIPVSDTRSAGKEVIAKKLVNFLLSQKAQTITTNFGFVSVRTDIENTVLPDDVEVYSVDWDQATEDEETIKSEYEAIFY